MVVFVLGVIVTLLVVVLLMVVELELVGAVDNKAGHYSVSPGRQQQAAAGLGRWAEREREATHVAVPGGADPTNGTNSDPRQQAKERMPQQPVCRCRCQAQWPGGARDGQTSTQEFTSSSSPPSWGKPHRHWTEPTGFPVTFSPVLRLPGGTWAEKINILGVK